ncbi:MAG: carbohydrate kinase [Caryophanon sp.]|nr:carbohydrate kinase [Caryophanon sp.]
MNEKEQRVLQLLRQNPFLSQQEMAQQLNMSRPAVANILSACMKDGKLLGRAYVFPEAKDIVCIGGANVDRKIHIRGALQMATSNPATSEETVGGVARNIAENLGRLGEAVRLITVAGDDAAWATIEEQSKPYMNVAAVEKLSTHQTGTYTAILNEAGDLVFAAADMDIYEQLTPALLQKHEQLLVHAKYIVADLNCPKETIAYLQQVANAHHVPLIVVPVSSPKMVHLPDDFTGITWLMCNRDEAESIVGYSLHEDVQFEQALQHIQQRGVANVIITNGSEKVWLRDASGRVLTKDVEAVEQVVDVTGAGDAFVAAFIYGLTAEKTLDGTLQLAMTNARETIQSTHTVRKNITKNQLHTEAN